MPSAFASCLRRFHFSCLTLRTFALVGIKPSSSTINGRRALARSVCSLRSDLRPCCRSQFRRNAPSSLFDRQGTLSPRPLHHASSCLPAPPPRAPSRPQASMAFLGMDENLEARSTGHAAAARRHRMQAAGGEAPPRRARPRNAPGNANRKTPQERRRNAPGKSRHALLRRSAFSWGVISCGVPVAYAGGIPGASHGFLERFAISWGVGRFPTAYGGTSTE